MASALQCFDDPELVLREDASESVGCENPRGVDSSGVGSKCLLSHDNVLAQPSLVL